MLLIFFWNFAMSKDCVQTLLQGIFFEHVNEVSQKIFVCTLLKFLDKENIMKIFPFDVLEF